MTRSHQVYNYHLPRRKMGRHTQTLTLPTGFVTLRLHFYGARQNVSTVWKMSQSQALCPARGSSPCK